MGLNKIEHNKELKSFNTFGISAKAQSFLALNSLSEAKSWFEENAVHEQAFLILGGGSNILITQDFDGLVIKNDLKGISVLEENEDSIVLKVGAGENWHHFVMHCVNNNYGGIENLSLIPGNVGASPMQNIGAYGVEVKEVITEVEAIKIEDGSIVKFSNEDCEFDYRSSIFKTRLKNQYFISSVSFKLNKKNQFNTSYGAIKNQLELHGVTEDQLSIKAISDAVIAIRKSKLPDPEEIGNSGSFFKNPVVKTSVFEKLKKQHKDMPAYALPKGGYKLAAGWLIEKTGWKGYQEGDYGVHKNQALVLVNYKDANGLDIYDLSERILRSVKKKFGVELEREVNII